MTRIWCSCIFHFFNELLTILCNIDASESTITLIKTSQCLREVLGLFVTPAQNHCIMAEPAKTNKKCLIEIEKSYWMKIYLVVLKSLSSFHEKAIKVL